MDYFNLEIEENESSNCKGLYFRGYKNSYYSNGKLEFKEGFRFLKRMSCSGCPKCDWFWDYIAEDSELTTISYQNDIIHNELYTIETICSRDWETGIYEIEEIEFVMVNK